MKYDFPNRWGLDDDNQGEQFDPFDFPEIELSLSEIIKARYEISRRMHLTQKKFTTQYSATLLSSNEDSVTERKAEAAEACSQLRLESNILNSQVQALDSVIANWSRIVAENT